jgi:hypothetical protein
VGIALIIKVVVNKYKQTVDRTDALVTTHKTARRHNPEEHITRLHGDTTQKNTSQDCTSTQPRRTHHKTARRHNPEEHITGLHGDTTQKNTSQDCTATQPRRTQCKFKLICLVELSNHNLSITNWFITNYLTSNFDEMKYEIFI